MVEQSERNDETRENDTHFNGDEMYLFYEVIWF